MKAAVNNPPAVDDAAKAAADESARVAAEEAAKQLEAAKGVDDAAKAAADESARVAAEEAAKKVIKVKSFDEEFSERFEGKYKSPDEIKAILNAPKIEFADDEVKHWNELKKSGIKLDKEFFELQALNLDGDAKGDIDPQFVLLEAMKRKDEGKGLPEKTLQHLINKKYNFNEWSEKDEAELTDDDLSNRAIMMRDAQNDLGWLKNYKTERTFVKPVDENAVRLQNENREASYKQFDAIVDAEVIAKVTNLSTIIDDKTGEKFDYKISEADGKEFGNLMKNLARGTSNLFDQFAYTDDKGAKQYNHQKVFEMLIRNKNYDQAIKNAYNDGKALGAKKEIIDLKNTSFKQPDGKIVDAEPKTEQEAMKIAMRKKVMEGN
jgi:2-polyprenyl-3-methyl-5-hydroxy-6-metoxy-1,4-benzoquinol methylase